MNIPDYDDTIGLRAIHAMYDRYVKQIHIEKSAGTYKIYLTLLFLGIEFIGIKIFKLNIGGYTLNQLSQMNRYEKMLIELGEENILNPGGDWPPLVRIVILAAINCVVFLIIKLIWTYLGPPFAEPITNMIAQFTNGSTTAAAPLTASPGGVSPPPTGGTDYGNLINGIMSMLGTNGLANLPGMTNEAPARRQPQFTE